MLSQPATQRAPLAALSAMLVAALGVVTALGAELPIVIGLVGVGLIAHGLNMFSYPAFTGAGDEGIYAAQAWAVLREGALSPYTYVYDHVPGGWILVAAWMALTGGPHAFGGAIDSGRVLMLLLALGSLVLVFRVARKLGAPLAIAAGVALVLAVSPLAIFYQRRLLLDNIMLFWVLLSLDVLLDGRGRLSRVTLSGLAFGLALLSKESAVFLLPAMLYIAWQQRWQHQGRFALLGWLIPLLVVVSWYPLYALLKGELLPAGVHFSSSGYGTTGSSLSDSLMWQLSRGGGGPLSLDNQFWTLLRTDWLARDALLLIAGTLATAVNLLRGLRRRNLDDRRGLATASLALFPLLYLARGGIVFDFYVLLVIPFLALNLAIVLGWLLGWVRVRWATPAVASAALLVVAGYWLVGTLSPLYTQRPGDAGREALGWIKGHVPADSQIITSDDLWTDLREPGLGGPGFPNVQSYTKVATDPAIHTGVYHDDWQLVDYLVTSPGLQDSLVADDNQVALGAWQHAHLVRQWQAEGSELELWKVDKPGETERALLANTDAYLTHHFEQSGAYVDASGAVTSEAQSYALLRAVWSDDRPTFDRAWAWTNANLSNAEGTLAWQWRSGGIVDSNSAADADTDTALALLLGAQRWNDPTLLAAGQALVAATWDHDVATVDGVPYMTAGDWAPPHDPVALNPSYFAPYAYRIFQAADPDHPWQQLVDSSYQVLFAASSGTLNDTRSAGLPPDWVGLDPSSGQVEPLTLDQADTTSYGYDAARTYWRVALDLRWDGDGRAATYLQQAGFLRDEVARDGFAGAVYAHDGTPVERAPSTVGTAGALAALLTLDPDQANHLYAGQIVGDTTTTSTGSAWGDPTDLYTQEWAWFSAALYADALPDLWQQPS